MQYLFSRRDTVFMKYILPCFFAVILAFGFFAGSVQRVDAVIPPLAIAIGKWVGLGVLSWLQSQILSEAFKSLIGDSKTKTEYTDKVSISMPYNIMNGKYLFFPCVDTRRDWAVSGYNGGAALVDGHFDGACDKGSAKYTIVSPDLPWAGVYYTPYDLGVGYMWQNNSAYSPGVCWFTSHQEPLRMSAPGKPPNQSVTFGSWSTIVDGKTVPESARVQFYAGWCIDVDTIPLGNQVLLDYRNPQTRLGSIAGNYLYLHDDYNKDSNPEAYDTYLNVSLVDEVNKTFYNPVTGTRANFKDWQYNYPTLSYDLTLEDGSRVSVTWGDEYCTIQEGGKSYTLYYLSADYKPEHTHVYEAVESLDPSCTYPGYRKYRCSGCGDEYTEEIPALGHDWICVEHVASTTDADGYDLYRCSRCGEERREYGGGTPSDGLFGSIASFIKRGITWCLDKLRQVVDGLKGITDTFGEFSGKLGDLTGGFVKFVTAALDTVPEPLITLMWFSLVALAVLAVVFRFIR